MNTTIDQEKENKYEIKKELEDSVVDDWKNEDIDKIASNIKINKN